jgi:hypothetical protein
MRHLPAHLVCYLKLGRPLMRQLHRELGDRRPCTRSVPKRLRRQVERSKDQRDKAALHRALTTGEELVVPARKRDAWWWFW